MKNKKRGSIKKTKPQCAFQFYLMVFCAMLVSSCSQSFSKINSVEFVPINYEVILVNEKSIISQPSITVAFNKYYNESTLPLEFVNKYRTDTISYKKQMAIECFLGNQNKFKSIGIDQVVENKSEIKVYFEAKTNEDENSFFQPFLIAKIHKTRKNFTFYLNGEDLKLGLQNVYVK